MKGKVNPFLVSIIETVYCCMAIDTLSVGA